MKLKLSTLMPVRLVAIVLIGSAVFTLPLTGMADSYTINNTINDAFLANGPTGNLAANNYGGAGTLAIAPAASSKGEFDSVIKFNTSLAVSQFNTSYGAGNWTITGLTLSLASNTGTEGGNPGNTLFNTIHGGSFGIDWIQNDSWVEGSGTPGSPSGTGVNFNSISTLLAVNDSLGTYTYTPPGNNVYANYSLLLDAGLVSDAVAGGDVSLYFYAADNQISYLFNSSTFAQARPQLTLTIQPVPEPGTVSLLAASLGGIVCWRRRKQKK